MSWRSRFQEYDYPTFDFDFFFLLEALEGSSDERQMSVGWRRKLFVCGCVRDDGFQCAFGFPVIVIRFPSLFPDSLDGG